MSDYYEEDFYEQEDSFEEDEKITEEELNEQINHLSDKEDVLVDALQQYFNEIKSHGELTPEESLELLKALRKGDESAREKIILGNIRVPIAAAKPFKKYDDFLDLIGVGNIALTRSVDYYDINSSVSFGVYSYYAAKNAIIWHLLHGTKSRGVKLPQLKQRLLLKLRSARDIFEKENGRTPTTEELASICNTTQDVVLDLFPLFDSDLSLDYTYSTDSQDEDTTLMESIEQTTFSSPEESILELDLKECINRALQELNEKERIAIIRLYGLNGEERLTERELAKRYGDTYQAWSLRKKSGLAKLKKVSRRYGLKDHMYG